MAGNKEIATNNLIKARKVGRPKGVKSLRTLEKERVLEAYKQRVMSSADRLLNAQFSIALGQQFLYRIDKTEVKGPKGGITYRNEKPVLVTSAEEIQDYLDGKYVEGDADDHNDPSASYYYITTKEPENQALEGILNRTFGKPSEDKMPTVAVQINMRDSKDEFLA